MVNFRFWLRGGCGVGPRQLVEYFRLLPGKHYCGKTPLDFSNMLNSKDILATEES